MNSLAAPFTTPGRDLSPVWFISLSLLLHLTLFLSAAPESFTTLPSAPAQNSNLAVHLVRYSAPQPDVAQTAPRQIAPARPPQAVPTPSHPSEAPKTSQPAATPQEESTIADGNTLATEGAALSARDNIRKAPDAKAQKQHLQIVLEQVLKKHFHYPLLAQRRGWQGEVILALRLESDGRILDARVARSSGYGVLDRAALRALDKVRHLPHSGHHTFTLKVPVIYRLEG